MFRKTGRLLRVFAWILTVAGIAGSWFYFAWAEYPYFYYYGGSYPGAFVPDLLAAIGGTFLAWLLGALVFALGRIVESSAEAAAEARRQTELLERMASRREAAPPAPRERVCPVCSNRQESELKFCRLCGAEMTVTGDE